MQNVLPSLFKSRRFSDTARGIGMSKKYYLTLMQSLTSDLNLYNYSLRLHGYATASHT